jgi:L-ascorbate metabolism protein UlaG (beta-lactamase superfamily)
MVIQWLGQSCFKISTKNTQGEFTIATDPFTDQGGFKMPKFQADVVTISQNHDDHNNIDAIKGDPMVITQPGEYETKGIFIYGIPAVNEKEKVKSTVYKIVAEEIIIGHLGSLAQNLTDDQIERLGNVDILMIPVGGKNYLDGKKAAEAISQIEPRLVIPMHYKTGDMKLDLNGVEEFLKVSGLKSETLDKLKIAKKDLIGEDTRIIVLSQT